ncbi:MAG: hypothetical protein ACK4PR_04210 [Gammaproteobacteria bacterium]
MKEEDKKSFFIVNEKVDIAKVKQELSALMPMADSMLQIIAEELSDVLKNEAQLWYLQAWLQHMQITLELYQRVYDNIPDNVESSSVMMVNPLLDNSTIRDETVSYVHQLQSLSHLAAYSVFTSCVSSHLQNSLLIIDSYMQRAVHLIDVLMLDSYKSA